MSAWIDALNSTAAGWTVAMGRACWQGGAAIALVWLIGRALPKLSPRARCWLWRLAYLKLLAALFWSTPVDLPLLPAPAAPAISTVALAAAPPPLFAGHRSRPEPASRPRVLSSRAVVPEAASWLLLVWLMGVAGGGAGSVRSWRTTRHLRRRCRPVLDPGLAAIHAELCRGFGLRRAPRLLRTSRTAGPMLVGVLSPAILLPSSLLRECTPAELRLALAHELAHLQRRDLLWAMPAAVGRALFFFHPLVWLAQRELWLAQEMECDARAVVVTQAPPAEYGRMLLKVAVRRPAAALGVAAVGVVDSYRTLRRRLEAMRSMDHVAHGRWTGSAAVLAVLGLASMVPWRVVAQPGKVAPNPRRLSGHSDPVDSLSISPDGRLLVSGSSDGTVRVWDARTGEALRELAVPGKGFLHAVAFSPDGRLLAIASGGLKAERTSWGEVELWNAAAWTPVRTLKGHARLTSIAFSPDGKSVAGGGEAESLFLWDADSGEIKQTLAGHHGWAWGVAFAPDGQTIASSADDGTVRLWDASSGALRRTMAGPSGEARPVAYAPNGQTVASGNLRDGAVRQWNARTGALLRTLTAYKMDLWDMRGKPMPQRRTAHGFWIGALAFSPDGKTLASSGWDKTVKLWDARTGALLRTLTGHHEGVVSLAFSPDGKTLASGSARREGGRTAGEIYLWPMQ